MNEYYVAHFLAPSSIVGTQEAAPCFTGSLARCTTRAAVFITPTNSCQYRQRGFLCTAICILPMFRSRSCCFESTEAWDSSGVDNIKATNITHFITACAGVATSACASFVWAWWFDRWNFKMADSSNVTVNDLKFKLRTGSSTDSAINQCARRVRIQNLGSSILLLHQTVSCLRVTMIRKHCWFNHSKLHCCFRDHNLSHKLRREKASVAPGSLSVTHHCE